MLLALDIGNSAVKSAAFDAVWAQESHPHPVPLDVGRTRIASADDAVALLRAATAARNIDRIGGCSVVPRVSAWFDEACQTLELPVPTWISAGMQIPFRIVYLTPDTLGADRIAAVAGGLSLLGEDASVGLTKLDNLPCGAARPLVVIDAGTATTIEAIDRSGTYLGGPILASPALSFSALSRGTAQLPPTDTDVPASPIGTSTSHALQSGVMYGYVDAVRGLTGRVLGEVGRDALVVATGGWHPLLSEHIAEINCIRPHLVLEGVASLLVKNR